MTSLPTQKAALAAVVRDIVALHGKSQNEAARRFCFAMTEAGLYRFDWNTRAWELTDLGREALAE